jgi:methylated-DNA-protein-cysteine methyltransferase-like protein
MHFPKGRPMASMLEAEGVQVQDATVVDFKALFWDPMTEL